MVKNVPLSNDRPFHLRGSSFLMPCNGDDNDADMAIFLHGRQARADFVHIAHVIQVPISDARKNAIKRLTN